MIKSGPKIYSLPKHRPSVEQYIPPRSYNPLETDRRRMLPAGTLILEQQTEGVAIAGDTLGYLEDPEDQRQWARLIGGSFLITAQTLYDHASRPGAMNRHVDLPELANERNEFLTPEKYDQIALKMIGGAEDLSQAVAEAHATRQSINGQQYFRIARAFGNVGAMLASYPLELHGIRDQFGAQHVARKNTEDVYTAVTALSGKLRQEPTIAQLADRGSRFASYIFRENPVNQEVVRMYDLSLGQAEEARSQINR